MVFPKCPNRSAEQAFSAGLQLLPIISTDSSLAQDFAKKFPANVGMMRIGNTYGDVALDHKLMLAARVRAFKSQPDEILEQFFPLERSKGGHQATSLIMRSTPSIAGNRRFL